MRILDVIPSMDPVGGGPVSALQAALVAAERLGIEREVATLEPPDTNSDSSGIKIHRLGVSPDARLPARIARYGYTPRLARWLAENAGRYDVVIAHGLWNHASIGTWRGLKGRSTPYVIVAHGMLSPWFRQFRLKHAAKQAWWLLAQGRAVHDAAALLFTAEEERRLAENAFFPYRCTTRVAPSGINPPPPICPDAADEWAKVTAAFSARPYLLFLGRLHPVKGCDQLIAAYADLAEDLACDLVIAGPDTNQLGETLRRQARELGVGDRVHFPGMLHGDLKWAALRGASALVLPSHQENFGMVVAEALACGVPALITRRVNIWREAVEGGAALACEDTVDGLGAMLRRFAAMSLDERAAMSAQALATYEQHFTAIGSVKALVATLSEVALVPSDNFRERPPR